MKTKARAVGSIGRGAPCALSVLCLLMGCGGRSALDADEGRGSPSFAPDAGVYCSSGVEQGSGTCASPAQDAALSSGGDGGSDKAPDASTGIGSADSGGSDAPVSATEGGGKEIPDAGEAEAGPVDYGVDAGIDLSTACLGTENTLVLAGSGFYHKGPPSVWTWPGRESHGSVGPAGSLDSVSRLSIEWFSQEATVRTAFSTDAYWPKSPLAVRIYPDARWDPGSGNNLTSMSEEGHPGLDLVGGDGWMTECTGLEGEFQILELTTVALGTSFVVDTLTATFRVDCAGEVNVGCVHYLR